jgi:hypothetical protein
MALSKLKENIYARASMTWATKRRLNYAKMPRGGGVGGF